MTSVVAWRSPYQNQFRQRVHSLLHQGYKRALVEIKQRHKEEDITGLIVREIDSILKTRIFPWCAQYEVKENNPIEDGIRRGRSRLKPDIIIGSVTRTGRPRYEFEAKRLDEGKNKEKVYIGTAGMGCFINELYAVNYPEAIMVGYVQQGLISNWLPRIRDAIETENTGCLRFSPPIVQAAVIPEFPDEIVSTHVRPNRGPIAVYHILLDCKP